MLLRSTCGASVLGDGRPILLLEPSVLVTHSSCLTTAAPEDWDFPACSYSWEDPGYFKPLPLLLGLPSKESVNFECLCSSLWISMGLSAVLHLSSPYVPSFTVSIGLRPTCKSSELLSFPSAASLSLKAWWLESAWALAAPATGLLGMEEASLLLGGGGGWATSELCTVISSCFSLVWE